MKTTTLMILAARSMLYGAQAELRSQREENSRGKGR